MMAALHRFAVQNTARIALYRGALTLRFIIGPGGSVETCEILLDRVLHEDRCHIEWEPLRADLINVIRKLKFPPAGSETVVTKPLVFGTPLPGPRP